MATSKQYDHAATEKALDQAIAKLQTPKSATASACDLCKKWKSVEPLVDKAIALLNALGSIVPTAKKIATLLQEIEKLVDGICAAACPSS